MWRQRIRSFERIDILLLAISVGLLFLTLNYVGFLLNRKTPGFELDVEKWRVLTVQPYCLADPKCVRIDDYVEKIGNLSFAESKADRTLFLYRDFEDSTSAPITFRRGEERRVYFASYRPLGLSMPQIAMAIFGGAILSDKKWAFALPLFSMFLSDALYEVLYRSGLTTMAGCYEGQGVNFLLLAGITLIGIGMRRAQEGTHRHSPAPHSAKNPATRPT